MTTRYTTSAPARAWRGKVGMQAMAAAPLEPGASRQSWTGSAGPWTGPHCCGFSPVMGLVE